MKNRGNVYIKVIIALLMVFISVYFAKVLISLNILPTNLIIILVAGLISINMIADLCLFLKGKWIKIVTIILDTILVFTATLGIKYGIRTDDFLNQSFNNKYESATYNVVVLKANVAKKIEDISHYSLGYFNKDDDYQKVLKTINKKALVNPVGYEDIYEPYNNLIAGELDAIVLEESLLEDLKDFYTNMDDVTKVLYSFELKSENDSNPSIVDTLKPFSVYISGTDSDNKKISTKAKNDVNILLTINAKKRNILITYLPKETYVNIAGKDGGDMLIHTGIFGLDTTMKSIDNLLNINIDYSVKVIFKSLEKLIDTLGGIDIYSDVEFISEYIPSWKVLQGVNHLTGAEAVAYSREKKAYKKIPNHQDNKQQVLTEVINKITKTRTIISSYENILDALSELYVTDIPRELITELVKVTLENSKWTINSQTLSGVGETMITFTSPKNERKVVVPSEESLTEIKNNIKKVIEG